MNVGRKYNMRKHIGRSDRMTNLRSYQVTVAGVEVLVEVGWRWKWWYNGVDTYRS